MADDPYADAERRMKKAVEALQRDLQSIRTGRASPALVERLMVEYYGTPTPLLQIAGIHATDARTLTIQPWDKKALPDIEKAIQKSDIGINPQSDGKLLRLIVPMMSEEQRKKLVSRLKDLAEAARVSVRNIRRDENKRTDQGKADSKLTEDEVTRLKDEIDKVTKKSEQDIDAMFAGKSKEIMEA